MKEDLKIFADLVVRFFRPVIIASSSSSAAQTLLFDLGYVPPRQFKAFERLSANITALLTIIESVSQITEEQIEANPELVITNLRNGIEVVSNLVDDLKNMPLVLEAELSGSDLLTQTDILEKFPRKLFDLLAVEFLKEKYNRTYSILKLFGIIEVSAITNTANPLEFPHVEKVVNWHKFESLFTHPLDELRNTIRDNDQYFYEKTLNLVQELGLSLGLFPGYVFPDMNVLKFINNDPSIQNWEKIKTLEILRFPLEPGALEGICIDIYPLINRVQNKFHGLVLALRFDPGITRIDITEKLELDLSFSGSLAGGLGVVINEHNKFKFSTDLFSSPKELADDVQFNFAASLVRKPGTIDGEDDKFFRIGNIDGNRLEIGSFKALFGVEKKEYTKLYFELGLLDGLIVMKFDEADGFISKVLGKGIESNFNAGIGFSNSSGFYFTGSSGLDLTIPTHVNIGPLDIQSLQVALQIKEGKPSLSFGASIKVALGPVIVVVENIGLMLPDKNGVGPTGSRIGFKPPTGVGLTVDSGGIKGGGFLNLDVDKGEYFGVMELEFKDLFSMKAYGIINTKLPDGSNGFSLLIVITAEFTPIQLGFAFTLNGVGGLLGVNRTTRVDILKEGIRTNAIKSILFPENVVANISRIISDIKQVFPAQPGHFLIAPMAKIGWGTPTIITLELGLLIEIPSSRLIILGVLKALLPEEERPLLKLQVNFIGEIDFENKTISFDAILYDSTLLTFTLAGQMALRIAWGDKPVFVLSVGGFHPAFKEIPQGLEAMQRITINLINTSDVKITIQNYFAVTSNTVQFGAKAELLAAHGSWNIYGFIGYDVLFQFDPFKFIADFSAGIALRRHQSVVMGIRVSGTLSGPSPWDAKGSASVSFFFFSISIPFHKSWGDSAGAGETEKLDLIQMLIILVDDNRSWSAVIPSKKNLHVSIKAIPVEAGTLVIHPFGILSFSERLVPLGIDIDKVGTKLPKDDRHFDIVPTDADLQWEPLTEQFAPANFLQMTDSEKLARPSFESMQSGFKITGSESLISPMLINKSVDYEFSYLGRKKNVGKDKYHFGRDGFRNNAGAAVAKSQLSYTGKRVSVNAPEKVLVTEERFVVANTSNMQLYDGNMAASSYTEALQYHQQLLRIDPSLKDKLQVLSTVELQLN